MTFWLTLYQSGRWWIWSRKNDIHQHSIFDHHQELCGSQTSTPETGRQDSGDWNYQGRIGGEVFQRLENSPCARSYHHHLLTQLLPYSSSPNCNWYSRFRRLCQQPWLLATYHWVPRRSARIIHASRAATTPSWEDWSPCPCLPLLHPPYGSYSQASRYRSYEKTLFSGQFDSRHCQGRYS